MRKKPLGGVGSVIHLLWFLYSPDKSWLIKFVEHRVADSRVLRLIRKWLNAGVKEDQWSETKTGTLQGPVASPIRCG